MLILCRHNMPPHFCDDCHDSYEEGYRRGLEDAADICDGEATCEGIAQKCAAAIRAKLEEMK